MERDARDERDQRIEQLTAQLEAKRHEKPPFWGSDHEERGKNFGTLLGLVVCFGLPAFFILRGLLT